ncbi:MAG: DUF4249 domain-containing protein [Bacteroidota bacterium]
MKPNYRTAFLTLLCVIFTTQSCIDPVEPEFQLEEGLIFVEGFASTTPGASFVAVSESAFEFGFYVVNFIEGATVFFVNTGTSEQVPLIERESAYVPPDDFAVRPGETWQVQISLPDGKQLISIPETVLEPVAINGISATYDPELQFREAERRFIPGHAVEVSLTDPAAEENYYYWSFRSIENLDVCEKCRFSFLREGQCIQPPPGIVARPYYDYICESPCWRIRFTEGVNILEDRFVNGLDVNNFRVAELPLYTKEDMVVIIQQFSLTPDAFEFYRTLKDILDNNSGINAPPPAALIGNMRNAEDSEDLIFGRFTVAATTTASIFIDRTNIAEDQLEPLEPLITENFGEGPPPQVTTAPCSETRFRTAVPPEGWIDN